MEENNNQEEKQGIISTLTKEGVKSFWENLPFITKLKIIGIAAGIIVVIVVVILIVGTIQQTFLGFSDALLSGNSILESDIIENYEEYWSDFCSEGECSEDQVEAYQTLAEDQAKFYNRLDTLTDKYLTGTATTKKKMQYMILATLFYNYDIDDFLSGSAYNIDSTEDINYTVDTSDTANAYKEEYDTIKELIKQFKAYPLKCSTQDEYGNDTYYMLKDSDGNEYDLNWYQVALFKLGSYTLLNSSLDGIKSAIDSCSGTVDVDTSNATSVSIDNYYNYLLTSTFFDTRSNFENVFAEYAKDNNLSVSDLTSWQEEDLENVRASIIEEIKETVETYMGSEDDGYTTISSGTYYWWPIGSIETEEVDGIVYASGDPEYTTITSNYGPRTAPYTGFHGGVDIAGAYGETNVIASASGTVIEVFNGCSSTGSLGSACGGGYGNYVKILDSNGYTETYAHLYKDSITVSLQDVVSQGQVIGKVGSSGSSTGSHLHFQINAESTTLDPLNYISENNPRPEYTELLFEGTRYTKDEFVSLLQNYYNNNNVCGNSRCESFKKEVMGDGAEIIYEVAAEFGLNPELYVARSVLEGYSPGTGYNFFGYTCYNTSSGSCSSFSSFEAGVRAFFNNISKYDNARDMLSKYAYLGTYWYNSYGDSTGWGLGGCVYASYIYPDGVPNRVTEACNVTLHPCSSAEESTCVETTEDDREAYTTYQVQKMQIVIENIFG